MRTYHKVTVEVFGLYHTMDYSTVELDSEPDDSFSSSDLSDKFEFYFETESEAKEKMLEITAMFNE